MKQQSGRLQAQHVDGKRNDHALFAYREDAARIWGDSGKGETLRHAHELLLCPNMFPDKRAGTPTCGILEDACNDKRPKGTYALQRESLLGQRQPCMHRKRHSTQGRTPGTNTLRLSNTSQEASPNFAVFLYMLLKRSHINQP